MCLPNDDDAQTTKALVRLMLCPHGTYFLSIGNATLHLNEAELGLLGNAIHEMASRQPPLLARLAVHLLGQGHGGSAAGNVG